MNLHRLKKFRKIISIILALSLFMSLTISANISDGYIKIDETLKIELEKALSTDLIPVIIWTSETINQEEVEMTAKTLSMEIQNELLTANENLNKASQKSDKLNKFVVSDTDIHKLDNVQIDIEVKRNLYSQLYKESNNNVFNELFPSQKRTIFGTKNVEQPVVDWIGEFSPIIKTSLTKDQIYSVSKSSLIDTIYFDNLEMIEPEFPEALEITPLSSSNGVTPASTWQGTINVPYVRDSIGYDGAGIKVGICDGGVLRMTDSKMDPYRAPFVTAYNQGRLIADPSAPTNDPGHAAYCASLIISDTSVKGVAPKVTLYSTSGTGRAGQAEGAIEWLLSQGVNIISLSIGFGTPFNTYDYISRWLDHIAMQHDVHVVIAFGNDGPNKVDKGAMSYNLITVGSIDDKNTVSRTDDWIAGFSSYINDYNGSLPMKPDLVAPGDNIQTPLGTSGGTSISTPIVAGIAAQICQAAPQTKTNQALMKSILLAGIDDCGSSVTRRSSPGSNVAAMWYDTGAGTVDAKAARYIASYGRYAGVTMGSGTTTYTRTFTVASGDTFTRVNLSWLKNNILLGGHVTGAEPSNPACAVLYLEVKAPNGTIYRSERKSGNVQNICFIPPVTGTYTITVRKISTPSSSPNVYFGLSWY